MSYFDFNSAQEQASYDLIPKGALVPVRMTIRPGGYNDPGQGWNDGYATCNDSTGAIYLSCEFVVLEGEYARRKVRSLIGLHSYKGPEWANMGRALLKAILNSARGVHPGDNSPAAQNARRVGGFAELDGIEFLARVEWEKDLNGEDRNVIKTAVTPDHKDYAALMRRSERTQASAPTQPASATTGGRPSWAQ